MYGYWGKILHIDLATKRHWVEKKPEEWYKKYIGGVLMSSRLLWENIEVGCDALDPGNPICIANGIFAGTPVAVGSKYSVASKSPLTGFVGDSLSGSWFTVALKRSGWDAIVIHNVSDDWVYLLIDDDHIEFRDASALLGMRNLETMEAIQDVFQDDQVRVASIGKAGENLVRMADVTNDGRQIGRTGHGAVWGSKKLKAVAVRGTRGIKVADPEALLEQCYQISQAAQGPGTQKYRTLGTMANVLNLNRLGILPTRNYREGVFEYAEEMSGEHLYEHHRIRHVACAGCPISCEPVAKAISGPYKGVHTGVDYEPMYAVGTGCGLSDMNYAIAAMEICDEDGMDSMSAGVTVSWAMEAFERGIFTKEDFKCAKYPEGFEPYFGDGEAVVTLVEMMRDREGYMGDLLAEGVKRASEKVDEERGTETYQWAMHIKGLETPGYDARGLKTFALGLSVGVRGACHNRSAAYDPDIKGQVDRFSVDDTRGELASSTENYAAVYDTLPLCKFIRRCFTGKADRAGAWPAICQLINSTTGWDYEYDDLEALGERAWTMKKAFNIREGWTRADDHLPWRWANEGMLEGPSAGHFVTDEELEYMKDLYYEARGWTKDGMVPKSRLLKLGLDDAAEQIGVDDTEEGK